jgi:hypothetical protein
MARGCALGNLTSPKDRRREVHTSTGNGVHGVPDARVQTMLHGKTGPESSFPHHREPLGRSVEGAKVLTQ